LNLISSENTFRNEARSISYPWGCLSLEKQKINISKDVEKLDINAK
jgi:hypothetical protein